MNLKLLRLPYLLAKAVEEFLAVAFKVGDDCVFNWIGKQIEGIIRKIRVAFLFEPRLDCGHCQLERLEEHQSYLKVLKKRRKCAKVFSSSQTQGTTHPVS